MLSSFIYYITTNQQWANAQQLGYYTNPRLQAEEFIHCCTEKQINRVLDRYYNGVSHLLELTIDANRLQIPVKYETSLGVSRLFP